MKKIAIVGAGGFGMEIFCIWKERLLYDNVEFDFLGFFDDGKIGVKNGYGNVIGVIEDLNRIDEDVELGLGIGNSKILQNVRERIHNKKVSFPNIKHPSSRFLNEESIKLAEGNIFSINTIICNNVSLGNFNVLNTRVTIGHAVHAGNYNVFSPNVQISGEVSIGNRNLFGFNSGVMQSLKIGNENILGVGSILFKSIADKATYIGSPAKRFNI